jgi:hypothetical protein
MVHLVVYNVLNGYSIWMDHWKIIHQDSALKDVPDLTPGDLHREISRVCRYIYIHYGFIENTRVYIYKSIYLSIHPSIHLSIYLFIHLSVYIYIPIYIYLHIIYLHLDRSHITRIQVLNQQGQASSDDSKRESTAARASGLVNGWSFWQIWPRAPSLGKWEFYT